MPIVRPYIPETITVHLGSPSSSAENVTVSFDDYIKNVASSEIFPTWNEEAIRANILAQISFALNRVYTEFYPSKGYNFDITNSTAIDQAFSQGRNIFTNISQIVDEFFNDYIRRVGFVEPLAAKFCNGTTVTCQGLSQWGSEDLANQGYNYIDILTYYYGDDIEIVFDAPLAGRHVSYPGYPLSEGSQGSYVTVMQVAINRIAQNYPAIPKINPVDGIFGPKTKESVIKLQSIFNLTPDGIVGKATWYEIVRLYVGILKLNELNSLGQTFYDTSWAYPDPIKEGDTGYKVRLLQYMLSVLSEFYPAIPPVTVSGTFEAATKNAVLAFQSLAGLPQTGEVGAVTWDQMYDAYAGIAMTTLSRGELFPFQGDVPPAKNVLELQSQLASYAKAQPAMRPVEVSGKLDPATSQSIRRFQNINNLPATGKIDEETKNRLSLGLTDMRYSQTTRFTQYPGYDLNIGMRDTEGRSSNANQ